MSTIVFGILAGVFFVMYLLRRRRRLANED
jgi:hypothetical protein